MFDSYSHFWFAVLIRPSIRYYQCRMSTVCSAAYEQHVNLLMTLVIFSRN